MMLYLRAFSVITGVALAVAAFVTDTKTAVVADPWSDAPRTVMIPTPGRLPDVRSIKMSNPFAAHPDDLGSTSSSTSATVASAPVGPAAPLVVPLGAGAYNGVGTVPNPGGIANPSVVGATDTTGQVSVIATIVGGGNPPRALIRNGTDTDVVGSGDYLGNHVIKRIVTQGIELDDGTRIAVDTGHLSSTPPPVAAAGSPVTPTAAGSNPSAQPTLATRAAGVANPYGNGALGSGNAPVVNGSYGQGQGLFSEPSPVPIVTGGGSYAGTPTLAPGQTPYPITHYFSPPPAGH